jgi:transposase, IS5 family
MRKPYEVQQELGTIPITEVSISKKSRHELPPILLSLQEVFKDASLREPILEIVEEAVCGENTAMGRPGMSLWEIMVFGVVRLGLDADYDQLEDLANNHKSLRGILGVEQESGFSPAKSYHIQTLKDNVSLLTDEHIYQINELIVQAGHIVVKKKDVEGLRVKADSYVVETHIHYPTDTNLLYDSARKSLDMIAKLGEELSLSGWRKIKYWYRKMRRAERQLSSILGRGGKNRAQRVEAATRHYLSIATSLSQKLHQTQQDLAQEQLPIKAIALAEALSVYQGYLDKHIDLVDRRLLQGEQIPHHEKLFSIFEEHTEWIYKGKAKGAELGHKVLLATDQYHFILHAQVMEKQEDVELALPLAKSICQAYQLDKLDSISFDRGFYSKPNYEALQKYAHQVILPKKGKPNQEEELRESDSRFIKLRHQHSAIEANINQLEHHGLNKCPDKGIKAYKRYVAWGVLAYNLHRLGKHLIQQQQKKPKPPLRSKKAA